MDSMDKLSSTEIAEFEDWLERKTNLRFTIHLSKDILVNYSTSTIFQTIILKQCAALRRMRSSCGGTLHTHGKLSLMNAFI